MLVITQDTEQAFTIELESCAKQNESWRCLIFKFSKIKQKPEGWFANVLDRIANCLGDNGARAFLFGDDDVYILMRQATQRGFSALLGRLSALLAPANLKELSFLYEVSVDLETIRGFLAERNPKAASAKVEKIVVAPKSVLLDQVYYDEVVSTLASRRRRRDEQELHDDLMVFAQNHYDEIIDVGSAEGYYAIGSALLFKGTHVRAYDTDPLSQEVLRENAELNNVSDFVQSCGTCEHSTLIERTNDRRTLVILDCEGGEMDLLQGDGVVNSLKNSDLIVECHDFIHHNTTGLLVQRLYDSHRIKIVYSGGRDPSGFPFLSHLNDSQRWLLINENRPTLMNWLVCSSKNLTS